MNFINGFIEVFNSRFLGSMTAVMILLFSFLAIVTYVAFTLAKKAI